MLRQAEEQGDPALHRNSDIMRCKEEGRRGHGGQGGKPAVDGNSEEENGQSDILCEQCNIWLHGDQLADHNIGKRHRKSCRLLRLAAEQGDATAQRATNRSGGRSRISLC